MQGAGRSVGVRDTKVALWFATARGEYGGAFTDWGLLRRRVAGDWHEGVGHRYRRVARQDPRQRREGGTQVPFGAFDDSRNHGRRGRISRGGLEVEAISIGYPGPVLHNRPVVEPHNLAAGWTTFDFQRAFKCPVKFMNDAAMQALGSYRGGKVLFLGLGTGLGSAMIVDGIVEPMELAHLPYKRATYEDYIGRRGPEKYGEAKWQKHVADVVRQLIAALEPDDVVLGGGNAKRLNKLPEGCRTGDNANAFLGGSRLWMRRSASKAREAPTRPRTARRHVSTTAEARRRGP
jgi:polyphosphate glucokinase